MSTQINLPDDTESLMIEVQNMAPDERIKIINSSLPSGYNIFEEKMKVYFNGYQMELSERDEKMRDTWQNLDNSQKDHYQSLATIEFERNFRMSVDKFKRIKEILLDQSGGQRLKRKRQPSTKYSDQPVKKSRTDNLVMEDLNTLLEYIDPEPKRKRQKKSSAKPATGRTIQESAIITSTTTVPIQQYQPMTESAPSLKALEPIPLMQEPKKRRGRPRIYQAVETPKAKREPKNPTRTRKTVKPVLTKEEEIIHTLITLNNHLASTAETFYYKAETCK
eukprot:TRINITY_DN7109_c0_g1_i2.p1 TRINITY_DN7109_c0_g1~~TRINITY_DN7109_c0_g1_i2.p1  ORF type:complete len:278 (-),score=31.14 TRINITY_DN7109_c0_g1_i2:66-899(-)